MTLSFLYIKIKNEMLNIIEILEESKSINEVAIKIKGYCNGKTNKIAKRYIVDNGYEYKFFTPPKEKYYNKPKKCKNCKGVIPFEKRININFCSINCSATYNNKLRGPHSDKTKKKISLSLRGRKKDKNNNLFKEYKRECVFCGKEFIVERLECGVLSRKKTCGDVCRFKLKSKNSKRVMKKLIDSGKHKGWNSRNVISYPEKFFKKVLENNNIRYEFNKTISKRSLGIKSDSNYFLDFFIIDKNIDLEIDGKQHELKERKDSDEIRDKYLNKNGIIVYRIKWEDINTKNGKKYIKNEINKFLKFIE